MTSETKNCQNCKKDFVIEPDDFGFYEKIKVSPPTFCPECRLQRKMVRRNERTFYKINCANCKKEIISMYDKDTPFTVFCHDCWWSDKWDSLTYGVNPDLSKPFFNQFYELSLKFPRIALFQKGDINSMYTNHSDHNKNCYLAFNNGFIEDSMYSKWGIKSKQMFDCYSVLSSELIYESSDSKRCYKCIHAYYSKDCLNSSFIYNCHGCHDCFLSTNLRNKSYVFNNKQLTKDEYQKKLLKLNLGIYSKYFKTLKMFKEEVLLKTIRKYVFLGKSINSTGDNIFKSKNLKKCFHVIESENCAYCIDDSNVKDSYDAYEAAFNCELQYDCHDILYSDMCHNSHSLFACIGLRNKSYCILNKQYTKEEYEELVPRIIQHMNDMPYISTRKNLSIGSRQVYKYGEFFPPELSPFCYNETIAQEYFPLIKEEALEQGYRWKDKEAKNYTIDIKNEDIPNDIKETDDSIINKVIECGHQRKCNEQCTEAFKIIPDELAFYRRMNLPLPHLYPNCRHYNRLKQRNPLKLWHRKCMKEGCTNEFLKPVMLLIDRKLFIARGAISKKCIKIQCQQTQR